ELVADVAGSTGLYQTTIAFDDFGDDEPGDIVYADCTCPVGGECKHCVAVLIVNNQRMLKQRTSAILEAGSAWESGEVDIDDFAVGGPSGYGANGGGTYSPARRVQRPAWRLQLERMVEVSRRPSSQTEAVALGFELHRPAQRSYFDRGPSKLKVAELSDEPEPQLHIRPVVPGAKNNCIKGQAG